MVTWDVQHGDVLARLREMPERSVHCCITSPPYWGLRDYGVEGQLGLEATPEEYIEKMVCVFSEVRRVLKDDGTLWVNIGDCYNAYNGGAGPSSSLSQTQSRERPQLPTGFGLRNKNLKPKDLIGIPWMLAFALRTDGWFLRAEIPWLKRNPMPGSQQDRPTVGKESVFLFAKSQRYHFDLAAISKPAATGPWDAMPPIGGVKRAGGDNATYSGNQPEGDGTRVFRDTDLVLSEDGIVVFDIPTQPYAGAHFATYPERLVEPCVMAGCPVGGTVLDPFLGSGTTLAVAVRLGRSGVGIEINEDYVTLARNRIGRAERPSTWRDVGRGPADRGSLFDNETPGGGCRGGGEPPGRSDQERTAGASL